VLLEEQEGSNMEGKPTKGSGDGIVVKRIKNVSEREKGHENAHEAGNYQHHQSGLRNKSII